MAMRKIIKMFEDGNVCVVGLRGRGKDMLIANVVMRRQLPYVSNMDYGGIRFPLQFSDFECGGNTYKEFISGDLNFYDFPFPDYTDVYIGDAGVYLPSQYCNLLNRDYGFFATYMALSRQLGESNTHFNVQNLNRCWDKVREQSDQYIMCDWVCKPLIKRFGLVIQRVTIYESYDSAVRRVPPFRLPKPWFSPERRFQWKIQKQNYDISYGKITRRLLLYRNRSNYDTRVFKEMLLNGKKEEIT